MLPGALDVWGVKGFACGAVSVVGRALSGPVSGLSTLESEGARPPSCYWMGWASCDCRYIERLFTGPELPQLANYLDAMLVSPLASLV